MIHFTSTVSIPLGPLNISTHALMMSLGIMIAVFFAYREAKRKQMSLEIFDGLLNWAVVGGLVGARLLYVLLNPTNYNNLLDIFKIWQGGLVSFGGVIGGFLGVIIFLRWKKVDWVPYADLLAPYVLLGWGIGRIGDFIAWEEIGTVTSLPWGVDAGFGAARHPVQLYTLFTMTVGFLAIRRIGRMSHGAKRGLIFMVSGIYFFVERFFMEFLRDDVYGAAQLVSYRQFAQSMSVGLVLVLITWFYFASRFKGSKAMSLP